MRRRLFMRSIMAFVAVCGVTRVRNANAPRALIKLDHVPEASAVIAGDPYDYSWLPYEEYAIEEAGALRRG